jgi:hypothetical protein
MASEKRLHSRAKCYTGCIVMGHDGNTCEALVGDISLGGALVRVNGDTHLQVGDVCELMFSDKSALFPLKRVGKIARYDSGSMGVSFLS